MTRTKGHACEESPFFTPNPVVILDIISISQQGIKCKEWDGVDVKIPRKSDVETSPSNLGRVDDNRDPGERSQYTELCTR
jgi:hypothetical protein